MVRLKGKRRFSSAEIAKSFAESEYEKFRMVQDAMVESDFDLHIRKISGPESLS